MADPIYTSASPIAVNPADGELIGGALFTVHAPDDTSFSTPLAVTDPVSGAAITPLRSNSNGTLPAFKVTGDLPRVILKSGSLVTELVSLGGLVAEHVVAAGLDPATVSAAITASSSAAESATVATVAAASAASAATTATEKASAVASVIASNDGIMASVAADGESAFAQHLSATIAEAVASVVLPSIYSGRVVLFIGDSITNGSNATNASTFGYPAVVQQIAGSAAVVPVVSGWPGERADQIVSRLGGALDATPAVQHVHVQVGTNDAQQGRTLAQFQAAVTGFADTAIARGKTVSFGLIPPRAAAATAADVLIRLFNLWLSQWARSEGHLVADTFGALADPTTGFLRSDYDADGTHPNNAGHLALARAVAPVVVGKAVPYVSRDFFTSPLGLVSNPLMAGTTGWAVRSGSVTSRAVVPAEPGDGLRYGAWHRVVKDNTAGGSTAAVVVAHDLDTAKFSAGDVLLVHGRINHQGTPGGTSYISLVDGSSSLSYPGRAPSEITMPGEVLRTVTVPSSFTTLRIAHQLSVPAGGYLDSHVGECQVINLTTGGLVDAF